MARPLLRIQGLYKRFCREPRRNMRYALSDIAAEAAGKSPTDRLRQGEFWSLQDINLEDTRTQFSLYTALHLTYRFSFSVRASVQFESDYDYED